MAAAWLVNRSPFKPGQNAGKRPGKPIHHIADNRQAKRIIAGGVTIGIDDRRRIIGYGARQNMPQKGHSRQIKQILVATAHAP